MPDSLYIYSQRSSQSVGHVVAKHYNLNGPISCKFYVLGLHDNYLIESDNRKFILRIYRNSWRSHGEARFELELLDYLGSKTDQVARLVHTTRGELAFYIDSPEGERMGAMFHYADGHAPGRDINVGNSELLGRAVANIHIITVRYTPKYSRQALDIPYLLDESLFAIKPFIDSKGYSYLVKLQDKLHKVLPGLNKETGIYGLCIGDVNPTNFHVNPNKEITLFDFDQCGYGYRAFEIGKYFSSIHSHKETASLRDAFLNGYLQLRSLNNDEKAVIPYYEIVSVIWVMAIHAVNADRIGHKHLEKPFWDRKMALLEELETAYLN